MLTCKWYRLTWVLTTCLSVRWYFNLLMDIAAFIFHSLTSWLCRFFHSKVSLAAVGGLPWSIMSIFNRGDSDSPQLTLCGFQQKQLQSVCWHEDCIFKVPVTSKHYTTPRITTGSCGWQVNTGDNEKEWFWSSWSRLLVQGCDLRQRCSQALVGSISGIMPLSSSPAPLPFIHNLHCTSADSQSMRHKARLVGRSHAMSEQKRVRSSSQHEEICPRKWARWAEAEGIFQQSSRTCCLLRVEGKKEGKM